MSKIILFTASPQRDKFIDILLAEKLREMGNEVWVRQIPYKTRQAILEIMPDVVVIPPIRNQFALNFAQTLGKWNVGVVIRHIEPSCDTEDIKNMSSYWNKTLFFPRPINLKLEMMWGDTEVRIVKQRIKPPFPIVSVGAFVADIYKSGILKKQDGFAEKYGFNPNKKTLLVGSPWGLLDIESDHAGQSTHTLKQDEQAKDNWAEMVRLLHLKLSDKWNILLRPHPGVAGESFKNLSSKLGIGLDLETPAAELLYNCDVLVHAGSTMAVEMHWLDKPAFQFGDVNSLDLPDGNWWQRRNCAISRVSPFTTDVEKLAKMVNNCNGQSNANTDAIKELEEGRYGSMDGKATERAVELINKIDGKFTYTWPDPPADYNHPLAFRKMDWIVQKAQCQICENVFFAVRAEWLEMVSKYYKLKTPLKIPNICPCPHCATPTMMGKYVIEKES